jgi:adenine-specific DNA methylase
LIPKECKRLAEVDFPVADVSRHSAREKSIRHGHPSTLHLWWARRPLAACRAMLMALLLPDPCDVNCPAEFREEARQLLKPLPNCGATGSNKELRDSLLKFIADFANWDNSAKPAYLNCARGLVKAAHGEEPPLVVDPFAGGGSIPLEALRIGCDAFASDLNPVACLILKVLLEDVPRHGPKLAEELRVIGKQIKEEAEKELAEYFPRDHDGARPIAYLWARTVRCEAVGCGAEIPLMRSSWLCKKANRRRSLKLVPEPSPKHPKDPLNTLAGEKGAWRFEVLEPKSESEVRSGTVTRGNAVCPCCNGVLPVARVRAQLAAEHGGADVKFDSKGQRIGGARLLAVVALDEHKAGRQYRLPTERDYDAVRKATNALEKVAAEKLANGLSPIPDEPLPPQGTLGFRVQLYGMRQWGDLFTARQKFVLVCLTRQVDYHTDRGSMQSLLALALNRVVMSDMSLTRWNAYAEKMQHTFGRQALPIVWDFAEVVPTAEAPGNWESGYELVSDVVEMQPNGSTTGHAGQADARRSSLPDEGSQVWFTDPPYYDAIPYADLSDFFFVWLRRTLPGDPLLRNPFEPENPLTPKCPEIVQDETKHMADGRRKDKAFFEESMQQAFAEGRRVLREDGIGSVVFAHKTTEGWEALISGMLTGGWTVTASWPITTEMATRLRARESAALAASVHLVCRPRPENAGTGGWEDILRELPNRIGDWMERLSGEGIRGADLVFSCIGPALELFSKYDKVETAEGREVKLPEFLEKVWEVVGRTALQQILGTAEARARNGAAGALEEDARLTALFLWTLQGTNGEAKRGKAETGNQEEDLDETDGEDSEEEEGEPKAKKGFTLIYDVVRRFAQPLGIHLNNWEGRVVETKKGLVRLIPVMERSEQLFGQAGTEAVARAIERSHGESPQFALFPDQERIPDAPFKTRRGGRGHRADTGDAKLKPTAPPREATTLDCVHAAMLLQAGGQAAALRAMLEAETQRSPDFLRLANALSALYPKGSEEKRVLDAMILTVPR